MSATQYGNGYLGSKFQSSSSTTTMTTSFKLNEKEEIIHLNNRLSQYVEKVRQLGDGGSNSNAFLATLGSVEEEVVRLKALYETELVSLRSKLDEANKAKNENSAELERFQRAARDFEDRFQVEVGKNGRLVSSVGLLQTRVANLEHELKVTVDAAALSRGQLVGVKDELTKARQQISELSQQLQHEKASSQQLADQVDDLHQQLDFKVQVHAEQLSDASVRVEESKVVIGQLESRARELESHNGSLPNLLEQMRKKTEEDIRIYKEEMYASSNKTIAELKAQIEAQLSNLEHLRQVNAKLQSECDSFEVKVRAAEGKVKEVQSQKVFMAEQLKLEKARAIEQTRVLEVKLHDLQQTLLTKMTEINTNNDVQISLRQEIEAMRLILEEEERRLEAIRKQTSQAYVYKQNDVNRYTRQLESSSVHADTTNWQMQTQQGGTTKSMNASQTGLGVRQKEDINVTSATRGYGVSFKTPGVSYGYRSGAAYQDSYHNSGTNTQGHDYIYKVKGGTSLPSWKDQNSHSVVYKQTRCHTCHGGFPKIDGGSTKSYDIRRDGSYANKKSGTIRYI